MLLILSPFISFFMFWSCQVHFTIDQVSIYALIDTVSVCVREETSRVHDYLYSDHGS